MLDNLIRAAYESSTPFLSPRTALTDLCSSLKITNGDVSNLFIYDADPEGDGTQAFIHFGSTLSRMSATRSVFYAQPNVPVSYLWVVKNEYGMICLVQHHSLHYWPLPNEVFVTVERDLSVDSQRLMTIDKAPILTSKRTKDTTFVHLYFQVLADKKDGYIRLVKADTTHLLHPIMVLISLEDRFRFASCICVDPAGPPPLRSVYVSIDNTFRGK